MSRRLHRILTRAYWPLTFLFLIGAAMGCVHSLIAAALLLTVQLHHLVTHRDTLITFLHLTPTRN